jgi:hypothetical protein
LQVWLISGRQQTVSPKKRDPGVRKYAGEWSSSGPGTPLCGVMRARRRRQCKKKDEIPSYTVPMVDTPCNVGACRFACGSSGTSGFFHPRRMRLSQHIIKHFPGVCPLAAAIFQQRVTRFLIRRCFIVVLLVKGAQCKT